MHKYRLNLASIFYIMSTLGLVVPASSKVYDRNIQALPVWRQGASIRDEPVMFRDNSSGEICANLLFEPERILSISAADGTVEYDVSDFSIVGRAICSEGDILHLTEAEIYPSDSSGGTQPHIESGRLIKYGERDTFHCKQVNVSYTASDSWHGPLPRSQAQYLQGFNQRLTESLPVKIVLLGDSISFGANASATTPVYPFQPPYIELVADRLSLRYASSIDVANLSVGGQNIFWAESQISAIVEEEPNLVIIAFGMNDASSEMSVGDFSITLIRIIEAIKLAKSNPEVLIVSGMTPNPDWSLSRMGRRQPFHDAMNEVCQDYQVAFCDVYSVWNYLVRKKDFLSLTGNGVNHPNDYGHRVYADIVLETIVQ